jgi:hypothetical protein
VQELLKLASHQARGDVVSMEGLAELVPWHLVAVLKSGSEVSPLSISGTMKLLGCIHNLLELSIVQEPKLGLNDAKQVIRLEWIRCLSEQRRVRRQEAGVGVHHWLVVWLAHSTMHEILHQHSHELVLRG